MSRRALLAIGAAALLLAGCATAALPGGAGGAPEETEPPAYTATPLVPLRHPDVVALCPDAPARHLDVAAAEVVGVLRCTTEIGVDGAPSVERVDRLAGDPAELLAAYAADDEAAPSDQVCTLDLADPIILWLELAAGQTIAVRAPVDVCGKPQAAAKAAVEAATFEPVLERPLDGEG